MTRPCVQVRLTRPRARPDDRFGVRGRAAIRGAAVAAATMLALAARARRLRARLPGQHDAGRRRPAQSCDDGTCTLREAVLFAQADRHDHACPAGDYVLTHGELAAPRRHDQRRAARARRSSTATHRRACSRSPAPASGTADLDGDRRDDPRRQRRPAPTGAERLGGGVLRPERHRSSSTTATSSATRRDQRPAAASRIQAAPTASTMIGTTVAGNTVDGPLGRRWRHRSDRRERRHRPAQLDRQRQPALATDGDLEREAGSSPAALARLLLSHVTIAGNQARSAVALAMRGPTTGGRQPDEQHDLIAGNTGTACAPGALTGVATHHNLIHDSTCALGGASDIQGVNAALLGPDEQRRPDRHARAAGRQSGDQRGRLAACADGPARRHAAAGGLRHRRVRVRRADAHGDHQRDQRQRRHGRLAHLSRHAQRRATSPAARPRPPATFTLEPATFNVSSRAPRLHGHVSAATARRPVT